MISIKDIYSITTHMNQSESTNADLIQKFSIFLKSCDLWNDEVEKYINSEISFDDIKFIKSKRFNNLEIKPFIKLCEKDPTYSKLSLKIKISNFDYENKIDENDSTFKAIKSLVRLMYKVFKPTGVYFASEVDDCKIIHCSIIKNNNEDLRNFYYAVFNENWEIIFDIFGHHNDYIKKKDTIEYFLY